MQNEAAKPNRDCPEAFGFYLSAFLSAAFSVFYVLRYEDAVAYKRIEKAWRGKLSQGDRVLLNRLWGQRNAEVHKTGAETDAKQKPVPANQALSAERSHWWAIHFLNTLPLDEMPVEQASEDEFPPGTGAWVYVPEYRFTGAMATPVLEDCARLVNLLQSLVAECERHGEKTYIGESGG